MRALVAGLALAGAAWAQGAESEFYAVDWLTPPEGELLEVGGLDFLPDGALIASTRRGQVWIVEDPLAADPRAARFRLFAEGLDEGLGLTVVDGAILVVQRGELSRLVDADGDGRCDRVETVCDGWGLSGNYHEFAYGLPVDPQGNAFVSLNVSFLSPEWWHGKAPVPWRGWVVKIAPDKSLSPFACGFRSPCGLGWNARGDLFLTDNQGDWMPASPIFHVQEGRFYGHPASLDWTQEYRASQTLASNTVPPARAATDRTPPAVWLPYKWSRSPGNLVPDLTGGNFGPFEEQLFVAELTNGMVLRVDLERVRGEYQGSVIPFRQRVGSAVRLRFAPDGTLFAGLTNRGWGGLAPSSGIARVRWTGELPFEIQRVHLLQDGFEVTFTRPLSESALGPENAELVQYDYDYWWEYGSPERNVTERAVTALEHGADRRSLVVRVPELEAGMMARLTFLDVVAEDGTPLLHDEFAYTVNQLPEGPPAAHPIARLVPPPPARQSDDEGWLRLTYGDAMDRWVSSGWQLCDAELDPADPSRLATVEGVNALTNTAGPEPSDYVSKPVFGDAEIHVEFMLPEGAESGVLVQGRYEIRLRDGEEPRTLAPEDCGGVPPSAHAPGQAPLLWAYRGPGAWHELDLEFQAPRFDAAGKKVANARFLRVRLDDVLLHENVELPEATNGLAEVAEGPIVLRGDGGPVAFGNVRALAVRPLDAKRAEALEGWEELFDGEDLAGWRISDGGSWVVEDGVIIGSGTRSHLFSPRDDYADVRIRARLKISDGGNSGLYFRTEYGPEWPRGYEAQVNSSFADPQKTGSLYGSAPVTTGLVPPDTWFDYDVSCKDVDEGTLIEIRVNHVLITSFVDPERRHARGHVALQQHHEGSVVEVKRLAVRAP